MEEESVGANNNPFDTAVGSVTQLPQLPNQNSRHRNVLCVKQGFTTAGGAAQNVSPMSGVKMQSPVDSSALSIACCGRVGRHLEGSVGALRLPNIMSEAICVAHLQRTPVVLLLDAQVMVDYTSFS